MVRLKMIGAYDEAEVVAARYGASKMGVLEPGETSDPLYTGDDKDAIGNPIQDIAPGIVEVLPKGYKFNLIDPTLLPFAPPANNTTPVDPPQITGSPQRQTLLFGPFNHNQDLQFLFRL